MKSLSTRMAARRATKRARRIGYMKRQLRKPLDHTRPVDAATDHHLVECTMKAVEKLYQKPKPRPDGTLVSSMLSSSHREALVSIAGRMTHLVTGHVENSLGVTKDDPIRLARGLTAGGGKTLVAKCWMAAVVHVERPYSVVYAAAEVKALCDVYKDLVGDLEVPEEHVGIYHTLGKAADVPATPLSELHTKRILLVTHNLVRTGDINLHKYNQFGSAKAPRSLLIHDESLLVSDAMSLRSISVRNAHSHLKDLKDDGSIHARNGNFEPVLDYIADCKDRIVNAPTATKGRPVTVRLPNVEDYQGLSVMAAVNTLPPKCPPAAASLIKGSQCTLRVVQEASHAAAWFVPRVPDELKRVMVLDASYMIRSLTRRGTNIERDTTEVQPAFDYSGVTIEYFKHQAGRSYIETVECARPRTQRPLAKKIAEWITKRVPEDEHTIIWTFKTHPNGPDIKEKLLETLEHFGVDTDRVTVLTHGSSKGSNEFAAAKYVAVYGVFEPDKGVTGGHMLGQVSDEKADLSSLEDVHSDEVLHELYQELSRGNVRNINRGRAGEMNVFVGGWRVNTIRELGSDLVFSGATMTRREDLDAEQAREYVKTARSVIVALSKVDAGVAKVSSRGLNVTASKAVWKKAMKALEGDASTSLATELLAVGWQREGRGFVRVEVA